MDLTQLTETLSAIRSWWTTKGEIDAREQVLYTEADALRQQLQFVTFQLAELELRTGRAEPGTPPAVLQQRILRQVMGMDGEEQKS